MRSQEVDTLEGRLSQNEEETMHSLCVQALRLCTEMEGTTSLISRSDCRKGLRWKSAEVEDPSSFMAAANEVLESPAQGFNCRMENNGAISCVCLTRFSFQPQKKSIWALFLHVWQNVCIACLPCNAEIYPCTQQKVAFKAMDLLNLKMQLHDRDCRSIC